MDDREIILRCAEKMEAKPSIPGSDIWAVNISYLPEKKITHSVRSTYNPLHNDAQAMALVKSLGLKIVPVIEHGENLLHCWAVSPPKKCLCDEPKPTLSENLNRGICECVARLP